MSDRYSDDQPPVTLPRCVTEKCVLVVWIASFGVLVLLSFFIFVPITITVGYTDNHCLLYASSQWYGDISICSYCITSAIIFLCLCGLRLVLLIMKMVNFTSRITDKIAPCFNIWKVHLVIFCLDVSLLILLLITSCLLSAGVSTLCDNFFKGRELCSRSTLVLHNSDTYSSFYGTLTFAEGSAWFSFCYWLIVTAVEAYLLWKSGSFGGIRSQLTGHREQKSSADQSARRKVEISAPVPV